MSRKQIAERIASLYERRSLQGYVRWKVRSDPAYQAVLDALRGHELPLVDVGCGVGLLPFFLRENGHAAPILGVDFDQRKIDAARKAAAQYHGVEFRTGDARDALPAGHSIVILDILQYFDPASQQRILENAAQSVAPGGMIVMRQALRDDSWRYRLTAFVDALARVFRWMKAEHLIYPTRDDIARAFAGFESEIRPLWGNMPYNTYFLVFRRPVTARPAE